MTAKTEAENWADLYDDIVCRLKFEPLTRAEQYAQIRRAVAAERERCARVCEDQDTGQGLPHDIAVIECAAAIRKGE